MRIKQLGWGKPAAGNWDGALDAHANDLLANRWRHDELGAGIDGGFCVLPREGCADADVGRGAEIGAGAPHGVDGAPPREGELKHCDAAFNERTRNFCGLRVVVEPDYSHDL
jgi:hypothetical protein